MWIELLCFHLAEIGMIRTRDCSPTKSETTLGRHSMQGQVGSSSSETTVYVVVPPNQSSHCDNFESIFAYFFKSFFLIVRTMPRPTPMGIRHEVFALAREGINQGSIAARVGLTRATVNCILKRHAATGSWVPGKSSGASRKTTPRQDRVLLRMVRQDRFLGARALTARMRNLYRMRAGHTTVNNRLLSRGYRAYRPTTKPLLTANHCRLRLEWAQRWQNLTVTHWQHIIFGDESRFQLYPVDGRLRVHRLPVERFRPGCQADRVQAGGGSVHVWGAFHNSAKSPLVLPDGYLTGVLYRGILQNTLVPFARHYFGDNYRYQDENATPHRARVVLDFLQQGNVTKMKQPPRSPNCNPIEHLWDELGRAISSLQHLQRLEASMPRRLAAIIAARGGNTRYWPGTHKTRPPGSVTKKNHLCSTKFATTIFQWHLACTFGQLLILSSNVVKTDKTHQNKKWGIKYIENIILHHTTCP